MVYRLVPTEKMIIQWLTCYGLFLIMGASMMLALTSSLVHSQSFNCRTADRPDEVLICQNAQLSALDERMSSVYFTLRNQLSGSERQGLEASQQRWLRARMGYGRDFQCIEALYQRRIDFLRNY
jgi:uncharacterized protein